ncbi:LIM domain-containing protein A [Mugil cephalus]|uniref:LIM domain-containing protein A n=1 Tax=Mugil cephalus TaxID=48193 RepID=UPI001FB760AD|nr:LIM domain-containing protein A [Mugil cephalus]
MRQRLLLTSLWLAVFLSASVLAQDPVPIQFQPDPVLTQTGTDAVFTVLTRPEVLSITWEYQGLALGLWTGGASVINTVAQFEGRVSITATQLRIGSTQLRDAGTYSAGVIPLGTTGLAANTRSIQLRVFDAVAGVSLIVPSIAVEGRNVSLRCTWTAGTEVTVQWSKGGSVITANSRITISGGSLVINPARRNDAGSYTCEVSNPVSSLTSTQSLTIFYGPDTPVLTVESPKECVGGGDVLVGQTVRLTCVSDSLPAALFSWQRDGQPVASAQPDSGVLSLQTFSTNESGQYVCIARNTVTEGTSEQRTDLAIVDVCFSGGEVAGIVIGAFLLLIIIILLILLIVCLVRRRQGIGQRETVPVRKENPNQRPIPPDPQPVNVRNLGEGPNPPLHYTNAYTRLDNPRENRGNPQTLFMNGLNNSDTQQHNGHIHTNGLLNNTIQNANSYPHNGIDNPAFTRADAPNINTVPNTQQQNPNILIQTGQGGAQPSAVHVSLNTLPQTTQPNNNAQMPTIHVNLNSYPTNGQQTLQDSSYPLTHTANNNALEIQHNSINTAQSSPRNRSGQSFPSDPRQTGYISTDHEGQPGLIPTGHTHYNDNNIVQRNANTQTYQQDPVPNRRSDRNTGRHDADPGSSHRQMPWDRLRGTPAYPSGTLQRAEASPGHDSYTSDYTANPPRREARTPNRPEPRAQSQTVSRRRTPPRRDPSSTDTETQSSSDDHRRLNTSSATQLESSHRTHRSTHTQRERAQRDTRGLPSSQTAPRQEATHSNNPQALPLMSQHATVGRSAVSQAPTTQQGLTAPQGGDTRALADPNHLQQAHMAQQHRAAPIQTSPQGLGTQTQTATHGATEPRQVGTAPAPYPSAQSNHSNLTQAALKAHTERAQTFKNRNQQTQAALLHPGPQVQASAPGPQHPPTPPPVIPITQFQTLPKERTHRSPARGPQPPRPPVNMPVAQRQQQVHHRSNVQHHPTTKHSSHHHHHHGNGHGHVSAHHAHGHGHPTHNTHPGQQQTHRGKPR